jgi:CDP-diacylglycerol pyrophosphatase
MAHRLAWFAAVLLACLSASASLAAPLPPVKSVITRTEAAHPNALWHVVHGLCMRDMRLSGHPAPCVEVNTTGGYAVLKDIEHDTQFLLIPTTRVTGIESPILQRRGAPNYWRAAWKARRYIEQQRGAAIPREDIGLAVNSVYGRTQNQLHIHIDCVKPGILQLLKARQSEIGSRASDLGLRHRHYRVRWIADADLADVDPFKLLARTDHAARRDMASQTLVLVGAVRSNGQPGFDMLSDQASFVSDDDAAGEELLDHHCKVLERAGR